MSRRKSRSVPRARDTTLRCVADAIATSRSDHSLWLSARSFILSGRTLLVVLIFVAYLPVFQAEFVWDDDRFSSEGDFPTLEGLRSLWFAPQHSVMRSESGYWPLTYSTFWIERRIWGVHPLGYHLANVAIHSANSLLVWHLLALLQVPGAVLAALLFALHPTRAESVAWVIERKDLLSALFSLASFRFYIVFHHRRCWRPLALSVLFFLCAMLSKSVALTLPVFFIVWFWWKGRLPADSDSAAYPGTPRQSNIHLLASLIPFFVISGVFGFLGLWLTRRQENLIPYTTVAERLIIAGRSFWFYVAKTVWPSNLIPIYPKWPVEPHAYTQYLFPLLAGMLLIGLFIARRRIGRGSFAAMAFFGLTLSPTLGLIPFPLHEYSYVALRYGYLASAGLFALLSAVIWRFLRGLDERRRHTAQHLTLGCAIVLCVPLTWHHASQYHNMETLFKHCLRGNPNSLVAHNQLGIYYSVSNQSDKAVETFKKALSIDPHSPDIHYNLALVFSNRGELEAAVDHYEKAIALRPEHSATADTHNNLARLLQQKGRREEARVHFERAIALRCGDPESAWAHINLANLLWSENQFHDAESHYRIAIDLKPSDPEIAEAHRNLASVLATQQRFNEAKEHYTRAIAMKPAAEESAVPYTMLADIQSLQGQWHEAEASYRAALSLCRDPAKRRSIEQSLRDLAARRTDGEQGNE